MALFHICMSLALYLEKNTIFIVMQDLGRRKQPASDLYVAIATTSGQSKWSNQRSEAALRVQTQRGRQMS